jgi:hypothetical protein
VPRDLNARARDQQAAADTGRAAKGSRRKRQMRPSSRPGSAECARV